jgi:ferredoxin
MGHGPFADSGFDLQITDMGDGNFLVDLGKQRDWPNKASRAQSKKGATIIKKYKDLFDEASQDDLKRYREIREKAEKLPLKEGLQKNKALETMGKEALKEGMIEEMSDRCISCGACNYACPTCTCFNVIDLGDGKQGVRQRIMDFCVLGGYFRMAGGHNPKPQKAERTRNRYYCKLLWDKEKFEDSGCVGCGRCLDLCPVNIDIKEVIGSLT